MSKNIYPRPNKIFMAMFIDLIVVNIIGIGIVKVYAAIASNFLDKYTLSYIGFGIYCFCLLYVPILSAKAQTLGQKIYKFELRSQAGSKPSIAAAIGRWFCSIFSLVGYNQSPIPWFDRRFNLVLVTKKED